MNQYYNDYPKEPIGGGNPYYCCSYCKISDPQINGELKNHTEWCEYRIQNNSKIKVKDKVESLGPTGSVGIVGPVGPYVNHSIKVK